jgi:hypothetical protein
MKSIKRKQYRIILFPNATPVAEKIAIMAAKSNGIFNDENKFTFLDMEGIFKVTKYEYPNAYRDTVITIIGENKLTIDTMREKDAPAECELEIELVEIVELVEERDDLVNINFK